MTESIYIYHTNDIHSHFENLPKISSYVKGKVTQHQQAQEEVFVFDIGDHVDRWHPYTEALMGKGNVAELNEIGYDAVTIGNNEGITLAHHDLDTLYDAANFSVILANVFKQDGTHPAWCQPYQIITTKKGTSIGMIGVTANFEKLYNMLDWHITDPLETVKKYVDELKSKVDVLIVLSHLGIQDDECMAEMCPEIDVILGGHTHHTLPEGRRLGSTLICAAGKHGKYVGQVTLQWDEKEQSVHTEATLKETSSIPAPDNESDIVEAFHLYGKNLLLEEIAHLPQALTVDWFQPSPLPSLLCEGLLEWCEADCAFLNAGLVLTNLEAGAVTKYDVHKMLPHPINPCVVEIDGKSLSDVLLQTLDKKWPTYELKGLGFRGTLLGNFVYQNIDINRENLTIKINGNLLDNHKIYKLATADMYTFGHLIPMLHHFPIKYKMPEFLRDVFSWKLKATYR